jgi:hypothetical protein
MKKMIILLVAAALLAISLTSCRNTNRKRIRPLFHHTSIFAEIPYKNFYRQGTILNSRNKM